MKKESGSDTGRKTSAAGVPALLTVRDSYWPPHLSWGQDLEITITLSYKE